MKKMASDINISPTLMRGIVKHELGFYPHNIRQAYVEGENEASFGRAARQMCFSLLTNAIVRTIGNFFNMDTRGLKEHP
uniref:N-acetylmuramoyl-L-alanine amidase n=1 Tax=Heterorhabditis bacteriophora TaxID=37862 RepID=A0A1I7X798_HETBA